MLLLEDTQLLLGFSRCFEFSELSLQDVDFLDISLLYFPAHPFLILLPLNFQLAFQFGDNNFVHVINRLQVTNFLLKSGNWVLQSNELHLRSRLVLALRLGQVLLPFRQLLFHFYKLRDTLVNVPLFTPWSPFQVPQLSAEALQQPIFLSILCSEFVRFSQRLGCLVFRRLCLPRKLLSEFLELAVSFFDGLFQNLDFPFKSNFLLSQFLVDQLLVLQGAFGHFLALQGSFPFHC